MLLPILSLRWFKYNEKKPLDRQRDFKGAFNWVPMMPRDISLSVSCTYDRCSFSNLADTEHMFLRPEIFPIPHEEFFLESCQLKKNLDCNYPFQIDLSLKKFSINVEAIGKV